MRVLVTGGAGFIGSHTVEKLVEKGYEVLVVDNFYSGSLTNLTGIPREKLVLIEADISNWPLLWEKASQKMRSGDVAGIIHLAAVVNVVEVLEDPQYALDVNVKGTLNVLEIARRLDVKRVVYASSVAVYGEPQYLPVDEDHQLRPVNLYGETKLFGEELTWRYMEDYGLKPIALRYFNVYGPRMRPGPYAGVVYKFITALLNGDTPVIYGDGKQTRDFIYVDDVAEANVKALETSYTGPVNIGSGVETSINRLYKIICNLLGIFPKPRYESSRPEDVKRSQASTRKAKEILNWQPTTSLEEGLKKTIEYYDEIRYSREEV